MNILKIHKRQDGSHLGVFSPNDIPFPVKRVFFISSGDAQNCERGAHAHHECEQVLVCLSGRALLLYENKHFKGVIELTPGKTFYHKNLEWLTVEFKEKNSVIVSLCSEEYDEKDYIRSWEEFTKAMAQDVRGVELAHTQHLSNINITDEECAAIEKRIKRKMNTTDHQKAVYTTAINQGKTTKSRLLSVPTRDIAIVGSSASLMSSPKGEQIDSHDYVVRFNRAPTKGYEEIAGSKEDLRVVNRHAFANAPIPESYSNQSQHFIKNLKNKTLFYFDIEVRALMDYYLHIDPSCKLFYAVYGHLEGVKKELNIDLTPQFTTGLGFVCLCIVSGIKPTLYGFDVGPIEPIAGVIPRTHYWEERPNGVPYKPIDKLPDNRLMPEPDYIAQQYAHAQATNQAVDALKLRIGSTLLGPNFHKYARLLNPQTDYWNWKNLPPRGHDLQQERLILQRFADEGLINLR